MSVFFNLLARRFVITSSNAKLIKNDIYVGSVVAKMYFCACFIANQHVI
jgi:hypothetical protein